MSATLSPASQQAAPSPPARLGWRRLLRLCLRFVLPLTMVVALLAVAIIPMADALMRSWIQRDLDERAHLITKVLSEAMRTPLSPFEQHDAQELTRRLNQLTEDAHLSALAICNARGLLLASSQGFPPDQDCKGSPADSVMPLRAALSRWWRGWQMTRVPITLPDEYAEGVAPESAPAMPSTGSLIVVHDISNAWRRLQELQHYLLWLFLGLGLAVACVSLLAAHLSWRHWINSTLAVLRGGLSAHDKKRAAPEIAPIVADLQRLLRSVHEERSILKDTTIEWRPQTLKLLLREHLSGDEVIVVSNREPYSHHRADDGRLLVKRPASGLVTAVEPVMRACSGIWIAHGSGDADADVVDTRSHWQAPADGADGSASGGTYTLRRVWLSDEEYAGYYDGLANEGLWPLCHIAHVRPVFREEDWEHYRAVNARFADAVVAESQTDNPVVLVQDYHFGLLPRMLRERMPRATIITFWHIPWPNAESFSICPWAQEIIEGLLGSTILGFHTRLHGENFLHTADRFLESRIAREDATVLYQGHRTKVRDYPISIHWEPPVTFDPPRQDIDRRQLRVRYGLPPGHKLALGVDRLDYTKGIVERFQAVECLLDRHPEWRGRFSLIQIAAPSRSRLIAYQRLDERVRSEARRINERFAGSDANGIDAPPPIILQIKQHDGESVQAHYRGSDVAVVTSLHDGMNLVAKEFVAARDAEDGVLILSRFAGARAELTEALDVNPYHIEQTAETLAKALGMHPAEQRERMRALRSQVASCNVYRWAGLMLLDAAEERAREKVQDRIVRVATRHRVSHARSSFRSSS